MLSVSFNITWLNASDEEIVKNQTVTKYILSFTSIHRAIFILSTIVLFWIFFIIIYLTSRLILRILFKLKRSRLQSSSNPKVCQAFIISSNQYGSFRPKQTLNRSHSLFSNTDFILTNEYISTSDAVHLTINHYSNIIENGHCEPAKASLLEHYLKTYNPLQINLTNANKETISTSNIKETSYEDVPSETDTQPIDNCYPLNCTNKQRLYRLGRYVRLKEQDNCSATMSITDDRLSECSTKLTTTTLPVVMITDCSDSQRLHTDIIELNEDDEE